MPGENPGAYDEARKRIREGSDRETIVIEEQKEKFEKGKEKIRSGKKLDVYELRRRIETGHSLESLKNDIKKALDGGTITIDTYKDVLERIDIREKGEQKIEIKPDYILAPSDYPLADLPLTRYFESQKLGDNILIDIAGFTYGVAQGSVFLLWLAGRIVLDTLLLPIDLYTLARKK